MRNDLDMTRIEKVKVSQADEQEEGAQGYWNPTIMGRYPGRSRKDPSATCHDIFD